MDSYPIIKRLSVYNVKIVLMIKIMLTEESMECQMKRPLPSKKFFWTLILCLIKTIKCIQFILDGLFSTFLRMDPLPIFPRIL